VGGADGIRRSNYNQDAPSTGHDGRPGQGAFLAAADAGSKKQDSLFLEIRDAAVSVVPVAAQESLHNSSASSKPRACSRHR